MALVILGIAAFALASAAIVRARIRNVREAQVAARLPLGKDGIVLGAEPYRLQASTGRAVLLLHGFSDTPQSLRPLAEALHSAGWTVFVPLLPGHGRTLRAFADARAQDWIAAAHSAYDDLRASHEVVAVCGLSMGAALAVLLAAERPNIPALALLAPYLGMPRSLQMKVALAWVLHLAMPYRRSVGGETSIHDPKARARALGVGVVTARLLTELRNVARQAMHALPGVTAPTLYLQSREDNRVTERDAREHFLALGSREKEQRWLSGCGHIVTADYCKDEVARQVVEWVDRHSGSVRAAPD